MHNTALPDLAHTRPRAMHWLATAAATAAVVALAGLLQPTAATASQTARGNAPQAPAQARPAPDPATAAYPLKCHAGKPVVVHKATGDLDGDSNPETVAAVRCDSGIGTPPTGIYVLTGPGRVVATLLDPADQQNTTRLTITGRTVTATLLGYSSEAVARCCPDTKQRTTWQWRNGKFLRSATTDAQSV
ncbi:hypothetical protein GCM10010329_83200 [Streptomyces spiroverticillatus]|uniref:Secreted protein n=1 Tax=Streptomyces finlayi TaxID=67296 RepID=A0A918X0J1_9ACTN|nr:hypothetical protein [Streptomyces finlayi]GHA48223.1 hypothetical protein GCM10010329_83200 [Streptomyces spiroverticillatus]GHD01204.1 hypothetical protein GCM10010334_46600 [Streptomyces finlayi]